MDYLISHFWVLIIAAVIMAGIGIALQYFSVNNAKTKRKKVDKKDK